VEGEKCRRRWRRGRGEKEKRKEEEEEEEKIKGEEEIRDDPTLVTMVTVRRHHCGSRELAVVTISQK